MYAGPGRLPGRSPDAADESPLSGGSGSGGTQPRREGNDSLWKRARRTLGSQGLGFLQQPVKGEGKRKTVQPFMIFS